MSTRTVTDTEVVDAARDAAWITVERGGCLRRVLTPEGLYGRRKMIALIRRITIPGASRDAVDRAMQALGLARIRRDKSIRTTIPAKDGIRAGDLLNRDFTAPRPDHTWVMDFTYCRTWAGWVYVAFIVDVFSQRIVAWHTQTSKHVELVMIPLRMALWELGALDSAIALDVVPVAVAYRAVENEVDGLPPWTAAALDERGAAYPEVLPDTGEDIDYEAVAAADPDVILAHYSGIAEEQYETLSAIAPTVAYPGEPWATPWREIVTLTGDALGKPDEAQALLDEIDADIAARAAENPEFAGKAVAFVWDTAGVFYVWNESDPRVEILLDLGFVNAPAVDELDTGETSFSFSLSYERSTSSRATCSSCAATSRARSSGSLRRRTPERCRRCSAGRSRRSSALTSPRR